MPPISPDRSNARGWVGSLLRPGAIGTAAAGIIGTLAYTGGWLWPERPTQDRVMAAVHAANLTNSASPPGQSEAVCVTDWFKSAGQAVSRTAPVGRVPLVGRVALAGGMPFRTNAPETMHTTAPRFNTAGNSRQFATPAGQTIPVRWPVVPVQPFEPAGPAVEAGRTTLLDDVLNPTSQLVPLAHLLGILTIHADLTKATTPPDHRQPDHRQPDHQQIDAGTATTDRAETEDTSPCTAAGRGPAMLRAGIDPFDDPPRNARFSAYARLFSLPPQTHDDQPRSTIAPEAVSRDKGRS